MSDEVIVETTENINQVISDKKQFKYSEQQNINEEEWNLFSSLNIPFTKTEYGGTPKFLGISNDWTSYYIGASWLVSDNQKINEKTDKSLVVTPKMENIDFVGMLLTAFRFEKAAKYFSHYYDIDFDKPQIKTDTLKNQLTPLLLIHYLSLLEILTKKGLKKDYVLKEENLHAKVKGRIMLQKNLQKNVFVKRQDRTYCRFQEYTVDTPENRLLKKALLFGEKMLSLLKKNKCFTELDKKIKRIKANFELVSDDIEVCQIKNLRTNKMYKEYSKAIKVAKMILRRYDYSIANITEEREESVPPFWIDMSRLYEVYVYSLLEDRFPNKIEFQVKGYGKTAVDFIYTDGVILDTKYKPRYKDCNADIIADIREISGYARDEKILKHFLAEKRNTVVPCVIIYPEIQIWDLEAEDEEIDQNKDYVRINQLNNIDDIFKPENKNRIPGFLQFYKIGVELPQKAESN